MARMSPEPSVPKVPRGAVLFGGLAVAVAVLALWLAPQRLYPDHSARTLDSLGTAQRLTAVNARSTLQSNARTGMAQALGGLVVLWGAFVAWAAFRRDSTAAVEQRAHDRDVHVSDQVGQAITLLSADLTDVRVAGVFYLGQLVEAEPAYRLLAGEVLSTYVRDRSGKAKPAQVTPLADLRELRIHAPDVQAAVDVLGRHTFRWWAGDRFRFRYADLPRINLEERHVEGAKFTRADLRRAWAPGVLARYASFYGADLRGADLRGADLRDTNLRNANLDDADLEGAELAGAVFDARTTWPATCTKVDAESRDATEVPADDPPTTRDPAEVTAE